MRLTAGVASGMRAVPSCTACSAAVASGRTSAVAWTDLRPHIVVHVLHARIKNTAEAALLVPKRLDALLVAEAGLQQCALVISTDPFSCLFESLFEKLALMARRRQRDIE